MRFRRLRVAASRGVLAIALTALAPGPLGTATSFAAPGVAGAVPMADCTATTGVIVAVDFASFPGGAVEVACVLNPASGEEALVDGGFSPVPVTSQSGFAVCQLTDPATGTAEPATSCVNMPPTSAYWSYWHWLPGQSTWAYSTSGAGSYPPCQGSIEFWGFGSTVSGIDALRATFPLPTAIRSDATASVTDPNCPTSPPPTTTAQPAPSQPSASAQTTPPATAAFAPVGAQPSNSAAASATGPTGASQAGTTGGASPAATGQPSLSVTSTTRTPAGTNTSTSRTTVGAHGTTRTTASRVASTTTRPATSISSSSTATPGHQHPKGGTGGGQGPGGHRVRIADVPTSSTHPGNSGSPVGLIAGIGAVALLGGGAGVYTWRRHRRAQL